MAKDQTERTELSVDDKFELLIATLAARPESSLTKADLAEILGANAHQLRKAMKPENEENPNVTVFHPGGGPVEPLPFECFYKGFPVHKFPETCHDRELDLLRHLQPGTFTVICKDASALPVTVEPEYDANQRITKLSVEFGVTKDTKHTIPSMFVVLYQLVHHDHPKRRFMEAMQLNMDIMFPEVVGA